MCVSGDSFQPLPKNLSLLETPATQASFCLLKYLACISALPVLAYSEADLSFFVF